MRPRARCLPVLTVLLGATVAGLAQQRIPQIGYLYPAGCRQGGEVTVEIGGQFLMGTRGIITDTPGLEFEVLDYKRPISPKARDEMMDKLEPVRKEIGPYLWNQKIPYEKRIEKILEIAGERGVDRKTIEAFIEFREKQQDPKRQPNRQLEEVVIVKVKVAADMPPGPRELRLQSRMGISNPLKFFIGDFPEYAEQEPNDAEPTLTLKKEDLPAVINGQVMPGDVDLHAFEARKWTKLVARVQAREIKPYLADAVPGWFQATLTLRDAAGRALATVDDHAFHPDPVLQYVIPEDGRYTLEIKDSIYRGREDFVYRLELGELPLVTSYFPLGLREGTQTRVQLHGVNLPQEGLEVTAGEGSCGRIETTEIRGLPLAIPLRFDVGDLPEVTESGGPSPQQVDLPVVVNGRIMKAGEVDCYRLAGQAGMTLVAEVKARRLGSPLDSYLRVTDLQGNQIASADDVDDPSEGMMTHHADARVMVVLPGRADYIVSIGDIQNQGGEDYAYRLSLRPPRPDFELRVVPASITCLPGGSTDITVHVIRKEGFREPVHLDLPQAPAGYRLSARVVAGDQDQLALKLQVPKEAGADPIRLNLEGSAEIGGTRISRRAVPAEDRMQAFIYRHLVPADAWLVQSARRWKE